MARAVTAVRRCCERVAPSVSAWRTEPYHRIQIATDDRQIIRPVRPHASDCREQPFNSATLRMSSQEAVRLILCMPHGLRMPHGRQAWIQHSAGTCPKSWRDGFARDCPLRQPVPPMLALRDRAGAHRRFLGIFGAISVTLGGDPRRQDASRTRQSAGSRRSSREPGFVVRVGRSPNTLPRKADLGSGASARPMLAPDPRKLLRPCESASRLSRIVPVYPRSFF